MREFKQKAIQNSSELLFGTAPFPVQCGNQLVIGDGFVYPEINFTLPALQINNANWPQVMKHYQEIVQNVIQRARKLKSRGFVVEFEQLPPMTENPQWGAEITALLKKALNQVYENDGIKNALRVTIVDLRDDVRPPQLRDGKSFRQTISAFEMAAQAGADILSIESVGGKEVHDQALLYADIKGIVAALGILAHRDVGWLWQKISAICQENDVIPGGDTACGFANTAMQLAGQGMLPDLVAALVRAASIPRSLAAYENGAIGPSKDCAYEGPVIKAITGYPISMEGKSSCCAHFSPLGNIAGAMTDLWSNESVQNIRLLSGNAPEAFFELLEYDCRLFNTAVNSKNALSLRDMLVASDLSLNVQAQILEPLTVLKIADSIVNSSTGYRKTVAAIQTAFDSIRSSLNSGIVKLTESEESWLPRVDQEIQELPDNEESALGYLHEVYGELFTEKSYGLYENNMSLA